MKKKLTKISAFQGKYAVFSNFYPCFVVYEGMIFPSAEHAFQAAKTTDRNERVAFAVCPTAKEVKALGRKIQLRPDWEEIKVQVMTEAKCFIESATQLDLIRGGVLCYSEATAGSSQSQPAPIESPASENDASVPTSITSSAASPITSALIPMENDADYISQAIPVASGKIARFIIPVDSTADDLLLLRDLFDVLLKRKFKVQIE